MRHLIGFFLALAVAAALFFGGGWGITHVSSIASQGGNLTSQTGLMALGVVAATGLFLGIMLVAPFVSPLATGLPGLVLLAWTALLAVNAHRATTWIPLQSHAYGTGFRTLLVSGLLALIGAAMIIPIFVPSRWRSAHDEEDEMEESPLAATGLLS